jgi:uncharacterized protein DUF748
MPRVPRPLVALLALVVVIVALLAVLPSLVRWQVAARITVLTGRPVTIADVDLNLFTRRLVVSDLRILGRDRRDAVVALRRVEARFLLLPLFRGRVQVHDVAVVQPVLRLVRLPSGDWNVKDVIDRLRARPAAKPAWFALDRLSLTGGRVSVRDERATPLTEWLADALTVELRDVGTDRQHGTVTATGTLAGARTTIAVHDIRVSPLALRATVDVATLDLAPIARYGGTSTVTLARGTLTGHVVLTWDGPTGVLGAQAKGRIADVAIERQGAAEPVVSVPEITFTSRDVTVKHGAIAVGHFEASAAPTIVDASIDPAQRFDVAMLHAVIEGASLPAARRADVSITARLADGAEVDARGKARLLPLAGDLVVSLARVDLTRLHPYFPPAAPVAVGSGTLEAVLAVTLDSPRDVRASGDFAIADLSLLRRGQTEPFVRDPRLSGVVTDVRLAPGVITATRVAVAGTPVVVDATIARSPQRYELASFSVGAQDVGWPATAPLRIAAGVSLRGGGSSTLSGTLDVRTLEASVHATFTDIDLLRALPYLPPDPPVAPVRGRVSATVDMTHDTTRGVVVDADAVISDVAVVRKGQAQPLVTDPRLAARASGVIVKDGHVTATRLQVSGAPAVLDATATPPVRLDLATVALAAEDVTWPAQRAFRVSGNAALRDGGSSTIEGTVHAGTLAAQARATFTDLDLTLARGYLPPTILIAPSGGRLTADVQMSFARDQGVLLDGTATVTDLVLARTGQTEPVARDPRLTLAIGALTIKNSAVSVGKLDLTGTPLIVDTTGSAPRRFQVARLTASVVGELWPGQSPARVALAARLPERGALDALGTVVLAKHTANLSVELRDATIVPYRSLLPIPGEVNGELDAALDVTAAWGERLALSARGRLSARDLALGPPDAPVVWITALKATGVDVRWPDAIRMDHVMLEQPRAFVERDKSGAFPIRAMLTPAEASAPAGGNAATPARAAVITAREVTIVDGDVRFLDRSTTPFYSEELTHLTVELRGLTTVPDEHADVRVTGILGATAALDLSGQIAPFAHPFALEVHGSITDFAVPRTNPYLRRLLDWIAVRGQLTTQVHYRIVGDQLDASNDLVVERLDMAPAGPEPDKLVGLPLGLVVSLLKDTHGTIRLSVPITGSLTSPHFTFGDAVFMALRNVVTRLVTAPFRAIGSVFTAGEKIAEVKIDPLVFDAGGGSLNATGALHLQRVADFLRASPFVRLEVHPIVTVDDVGALRAHELAVRLERLQGRRGAKTFEDAARRLYARTFPGREFPKDIEQAVTDLRERQPVADQAIAALAARRLTTTLQALIDAAGIEPERLVPRDGAVTSPASGQPRVEFRLLPASTPG